MSTSLSTCLKKILKAGLILPASGQIDSVKLRGDKQSRMQAELVVHDSFTSVTAIRMDKMSHWPGLKGEGQWNKICDYLIIAQHKTQSYAIFVELKKTFSGNDAYKEQLRRTAPLWEYLRTVCRVEEQRQFPNVKKRHVAIFERVGDRFNKQPVRARQYAVENYKGIRVKTFIASTILFSQLIQT